MKELISIQSELKAPKGQYNSFGKYKYRSCEDILEAVKPLLKTHECALNLCDDIVNVGDRYYVKATARITNASGTASRYARKYALNGLFCIDDTKDADTDERRTENTNRAAAQSAKTAQSTETPANAPAPARKRITMEHLDDPITCDQLLKWMYGFLTTDNYAADFDAGARLLKYRDADAEVVDRFSALFESYRQARKNAK